MFRELSDIWPGSVPKGPKQGGAVGERRAEKSAGTLLNCTG